MTHLELAAVLSQPREAEKTKLLAASKTPLLLQGGREYSSFAAAVNIQQARQITENCFHPTTAKIPDFIVIKK
jgi:hypothetical protein